MIQKTWILVPAGCYVTSDYLFGLDFHISAVETAPNWYPVPTHTLDKPESLMPVRSDIAFCTVTV